MTCRCVPPCPKCDGDIPGFLRLTAEERKTAWASIPLTTVHTTAATEKGRYPKHWLDDPGTRALIAALETPAPIADEPKKLTRMASPREGSRKRQIWDVWQKDPDAALALGATLELKESTLRSWFAFWDRHEFTK